ncbi:MAG: ribbon-helix-helix protein, CopG family [Nitrospirota bacterium]
MQSQLTFRLSEDLDKDVASLAKRFGLKRSDIVRMALEKFLEEIEGRIETKPYDRIKHLVGSISSGIPDLGTSHREYLLRKFKKIA